MKSLLITAAVFSCMISQAQDSGNAVSSPLTITGYLEAYYSYDFSKPVQNDKNSFFYSHARHNEFNLNLGFIKAAYSTEKLRANVALAGGTYMNANYGSEPGSFKNVQPAIQQILTIRPCQTS